MYPSSKEAESKIKVICSKIHNLEERLKLSNDPIAELAIQNKIQFWNVKIGELMGF